MQAIDEDEVGYLIIPSFKSLKMKEAIDRTIKTEASIAKFKDGRTYEMQVNKLSRFDAISRIPLLNSDIVANPFIEERDCYDDLVQFCNNESPFLIIHKSKDIFSDQLFQPKTMKPSGSYTYPFYLYIFVPRAPIDLFYTLYKHCLL